MANLIRSTNLWGYAELVRDLGADPAAFMTVAGIRPGIEHEPDAFVPFATFCALLERTAAELGCPDLGLRMSRRQGLPMLGPLAVVARNAATVQEGFAAIGRYLYVHSPALQLSQVPAEDPGRVRCLYRITEPPTTGEHLPYEMSMGNAAGILRMLAGEGARLSLVSFQHGRVAPTWAYEEALGCPVAFGASWCGFEVTTELAERRIDHADPQTARVATAYLEATYPSVRASTTETVAGLVRRLLPTGQCTVEVVADQLSLHPRTLQRRLRAEGGGFAEIVDAQRRELAEHHLADPEMALAHIASLLGYSEQSAFTRSFRRWYATSPRAYRAALAG